MPRVCSALFRWLAERGIDDVRQVKAFHIAAWVECRLGDCVSRPTVKLESAAARRLFSWLAQHQVIPVSPAEAVRGPKHVVRTDQTPALSTVETGGFSGGCRHGRSPNCATGPLSQPWPMPLRGSPQRWPCMFGMSMFTISAGICAFPKRGARSSMFPVTTISKPGSGNTWRRVGCNSNRMHCYSVRLTAGVA